MPKSRRRSATGNVTSLPTAGGFDRLVQRFQWHLLLGLIGLYVALFCTLCLLKYRAYGYGDFDLAIFDQAVWSTARLEGFFPSSIRYGLLFSDHLSLILVGIVPLYWLLGWLVGGVPILLMIQTLALGGAAWPLFLLARRELGPPAGLAVVLSYLLYPALGYLNLFEFHPGVLAVFFLTWLLYCLHEEHWRRFLLFMALALLCREDVAAPVFMIGLYGLWRQARTGRTRSLDTLRWSVLPCLVAVLYFLVAVTVVIPACNPDGAGGTSPFVRLYAYLLDDSGQATTGEIVNRVLLHPVASLRQAAALDGKHIGLYTWHLLAPTGGFVLLAPMSLAMALPTWLQNVLAHKASTSTIFYQYTANIVPFVFYGLVLGLKRAGRTPLGRRPLVPVVLVVLAATVTSLLWGQQLRPGQEPYGVAAQVAGRRDFRLQEWRSGLVRDDTANIKDTFIARLAELEADAGGGPMSVVASFDLLHHLSRRSELTSWHYVKFGHDPITGRRLDPPQASHALLDFRDPLTFWGGFRHPLSGTLQRTYLHAGGWRIVHQADSVVLLAAGRGPTDVGRLAELVPAARLTTSGQARFDPPFGLELAAGTLEVRPVQIPGLSDRRQVVVTCSYRVRPGLGRHLGGDQFGLLAEFEVTGAETIYRRHWPLAYTLIDGADWIRTDPQDPDPQVVTVTYPLLLPVDAPPGTYSVRLSLKQHPDSPASLARARLGRIRLP